MQKSAVEVTLTSVATLVVLVILVSLANMIPIQNFYLSEILNFVNEYILIIILFTLFFFVGEVFCALGIPLNILGVVFCAYGGYLMTFFLFKIFYLIDSFMLVGIFAPFGYLEQTVCLIVLFAILVIGISKILIGRRKSVTSDKKEISWKDVWGEFKVGMDNLSKKFRENTGSKKEKEKVEEKKTEDKKTGKKKEKKKE